MPHFHDHARSDTLAHIRRTPDHDDAIEESTLSTAYDLTAKAWKVRPGSSDLYVVCKGTDEGTFKQRFGVPYSVCGCAPDPIESTNPVTRLASKIFKRGSKDLSTPGASTSNAASSTEPSSSTSSPQSGPANSRPDLISSEADDANATHPSEHNSVLVVGNKLGEVRKAARKDEIERRAILAEKAHRKAVEKGKRESWMDVQVVNREKRDTEKAKERSKDGDLAHDEAFSKVIPYWGVSLLPFGAYG